jgi:hypothetical protein
LDSSNSDIVSARASDDDSDWFSEVAKGECEADNENWFTDGSNEPEDVFVAMNGAEFSSEGTKFELFDSGCTQHISPNRDQFENFHSIPPGTKTFSCCKQAKFQRYRKGLACY